MSNFTRPIKTIFAGTPEFAKPYLLALLSDSDFDVMGIITQTDKPLGRSQELTMPIIKQVALDYSLKIWQPEILKISDNIIDEISSLKPDILVVVAYGQIIPKKLLDIFEKGCFNVHPSLLPLYRGASPIQNALLNGDSETGITIMLMDEKMDHGDILAVKKINLTGEETNESLHHDLALDGAPLLLKTIKDYCLGNLKSQPQDDSLATFCKLIKKDDGRINWSLSAKKIKDQINALHPWPGTWTTLSGQRLKIFPPVKIIDKHGSLGLAELIDNEMIVYCGQEALIIEKLQLSGKNPTSAQDFFRGQKQAIKFE